MGGGASCTCQGGALNLRRGLVSAKALLPALFSFLPVLLSWGSLSLFLSSRPGLGCSAPLPAALSLAGLGSPFFEW